MVAEYVEQNESGYWVKGSRVSLDSIVYAFLAGQTAESIAQSFPALALKQVYAAIAFYLDNREQVNAYLAKARARFCIRCNALRARQTRPSIKNWRMRATPVNGVTVKAPAPCRRRSEYSHSAGHNSA